MAISDLPAGSPLGTVVQKMIDLGFYDYIFPFIITSAILYALLKKSKIFGESLTINAVLSLSIAFMVFGFPVIVGMSLASPFSRFFTQATVFIMIFVVAMVMASVFYPDFMKMLADQFTKRSQVMQMIAIAIALLVTSGLVTVFTQGFNQVPGQKRPSTPGPSTDIILIAAALVIFIVLIFIAASMFRKSGGE